MRKAMVCWLAAGALAAAGPGTLAGEGPVEQYNVVWTTPSRDSSGSMPIGNGDIGLNVWVEQDGDALFYISKTDAWSENARLLKLGRVRVRLSPNPFARAAPFEQTLKLEDGEIVIRAGRAPAITLGIWVDANQPVIRLEAASQRPFGIEVALELWRRHERALKGREMFSAYGMNGAPHAVVVHPDTILDAQGGRIAWCHRNGTSIWPETMKLQGLESLMHTCRDPLLHRTFGGAIQGDGLVKQDATTLRSTHPRKRFAVAVCVLSQQAATIDEWVEQLERLVEGVEATSLERARADHRRWWAAFWQRSWIRVDAKTPAARITANSLPLRIGADSNGQNRFRGYISRARVFNRALNAAQIEELAHGAGFPLRQEPALAGDWTFDRLEDGRFANAAGDALAARVVGQARCVEHAGRRAIDLTGGGYVQIDAHPRLDLTQACTLEAWIAPEKLPAGGGRIIDKSAAGTSNGYLLDTYPGNSLRLIVRAGTLTHDAKLPPGRWTHVAGTFDADGGVQVLYIDGRAVASQALGRDMSEVCRGYALQRFISACAARGASPIKFNGTIFTVDAHEGGELYDADYRRWGGPYWFQNTRLAYWPMLASGDFEMMQPLFRMFLDARPLARGRTKLYFGHAGAFFPETMTFWGCYANENYGWNRKGKPASHVDNTYIRHYFSGGLELSAMMLDYYAYTHDEAFLTTTLLPLAGEIVEFYDHHYGRDEAGKMLFEPAQALETWQQAVNPLPVIAGLRFVLTGLLRLPSDRISARQRATWQRMLGELPELPATEHENTRALLPARTFSKLKNSENPELYAIFPYRIYGVGKGGLEVGRLTFARRRVKRTGGWTQDAIQAAFLGLADIASDYTTQNFTRHHSGSRFPAFWGPNFDWIPDQDHGGVALMALQTMLLQAEGSKILLFPAWPKAWDVAFKLHAPSRTTVEGVYRGGKLRRLAVSPPERAKDVVVMDAQ